MADDPISITPTILLGQWGDEADPGFEALNENWEKIDTAIALLQSTAGTIIDKADQSDLDALEGELQDLSDAIDAAAYIKANGTVPMAADLDLDGFKAVNVANGEDPQDAVTKGQLDAAIAAGLGALAGSYAYCLARTTVDILDDSPIRFEADANDGTTTNALLHDESTDPDRFIATQGGFYLFVARLKVTGAGGASLKWSKNGTEAPGSVMPQVRHDVGDDTTFITDVFMVQLDAADYVTLDVYGLVLDGGAIKADSTVSMFLLAANAVGGGDLKSDATIPMQAPFDNGGFRSSNSADAVDPTDLTTLQQVEAVAADLQTQIDDLSGSVGAGMSGDERVFDSGDQGFSTGDWEVVTDPDPNMQVVVASGTKFVVLRANGTAINTFDHRAILQLGISVQKNSDTPEVYAGTMCYDVLGYWVNGTVVADKQLTLTVGTWTFRLVAKKLAAVPYNPILSKNTNQPAYLSYVTG